jgi:hypothetical protein
LKATLKTGSAGIAVILILVLMFFAFWPRALAQTSVTFASVDVFSVPELNGVIRFSVNGSCSDAQLENNTWIFKDLRLNNSQPLGTLTISAQNSNVTVYSFRAQNLSGSSAILRYGVAGQGKQVVNLGLNVSRSTNSGEWSVVKNGGFLAEGREWELLPDNTVVVTGVVGNVSITHYNYNIPNTGNLPFYEQHSIAITVAVLIAITVTVALAIRVKARG